MPSVEVNFYGRGPGAFTRAERVWAWVRLLLALPLGSLRLALAKRRGRVADIVGMMDRYASLTEIAYGGFHHVDVTVGDRVWSASPASGMTVLPKNERGVRPTLSIPFELRAPLPDQHRFLSERFTYWRSILNAIGLWPTRWGVWSCASTAAWVLRLLEPCRWPVHVYRQIRENCNGT